MVKLLSAPGNHWCEIFLDKKIVDWCHSCRRGDTVENTAVRVKKFIEVLNDNLAALDLFKSSDKNLRREIKDK